MSDHQDQSSPEKSTDEQTPVSRTAAKVAQLLQADGFVSISLERMGSGHLWLAGVINGMPAKLLLDTGATHTILGRTCAERFDLTTEPGVARAGGLGTASATVSTAVVQELLLGDIAIEEARWPVLDLSHVTAILVGEGCEQIDGVVGADVLREREAIIDYASSIVYLRAEPRGAHAAA